MSLGSCLLANDPTGLGEAMIKARIDGKSWSDIAKEFNLPNPGAARKVFTKYTGIKDYKTKGQLLDNLVKEMSQKAAHTGTNIAMDVVKNTDDVLKKTAKQINSDTKLPWKSIDEIADDVGLTVSQVNDIRLGANLKETYSQIVNKTGATFDQVDRVVWNNNLSKWQGDVWKAYLEKPTSEMGFKAVQQKIFDLKAKGLDLNDILKLSDSPPEGVVRAVLDGTWKMPAPGSTVPIIPPPPAQVYAGPLKSTGTNFRRHSDGEMMDWISGLGSDLTPAQYKAIQSYTGSGYTRINGALRQKSTSRVTPTVKRIDEAMREIPFDTVVTRRVSGTHVFGTVDMNSMTGTVFVDHAFLSTSIAEGVWHGAVEMIINVPRGARGRYVRNISFHKSEYELMLARETKMVVTKVESRGYNSWRVFLEVIV